MNKRISIVTGAAKGIGKNIAKQLIEDNCFVVVVDVNENGQETITDYLGSENSEFVKCDIQNQDDIKSLFKVVKQKYGKVDILVNNAGVIRDSMTRKMTDDQWNLVIDVNLKGVFNLVRYIGPHMETIGGGSIINISSVVGEYGNIGQANYAATKAGLIGLTKTWARIR